MVIMITGAGRGIGRALTLHYLAQGARVGAVVRHRDAKMQLEHSATNHQGALRIYQADVTDLQRMREVTLEIERELGDIDLVIANAGIGDYRSCADFNAERFATVMQTNTIGVANTFETAMRIMRDRRRGQLVAISSLAAVQALPRMSTYGASKAALNHQMEALYWDLKPYGVAVTTVCPGFVDTDMVAQVGINQCWKMPQHVAVNRIARAIERRPRVHYFPVWLYVLLRAVSLTPETLKGLLVTRVFDLLLPSPSKNWHNSRSTTGPSRTT